MALILRHQGDAIFLQLIVVPRSSRDTICGEQDGALRIKVTAPPVEGAANTAVCALLAKKLGLSRSNVQVVRGHRGKRKTVSVRGVGPEVVAALATP